MKVKIKCPKCGEQIEINIVNGQIVTSEKDTNIELSEEEMKSFLDEQGISLG